MLILKKISFFIQNNLNKNYLLVFVSVFSFITALGTLYSIYNSADSNPKLVWFFLLLGLVSFFILFISISAEILKLIKNIRLNAAGSILQKKIVAVFATIAIIPVLIVAIFAVIFFEKGIQGWFSKRVATALEKSAAIAENYTQETRKRIEGDILFIALRLSQINDINYKNKNNIDYLLNTLSTDRGANELAIISSKGNILFASRNSYFLPSNISPSKIFSQRANTESPIVFLETNNNRINVITPIIGHIGLYLFFSRYLDPVIIYNLRSVQQAINDYNLAKKESTGSRITFTMVFIAVAVLLLLLAVWLGINFANSITHPIALLVEASERVSKGNLKFKITSNSNKNNEIYKLIISFNEMIKQLYDQRKDLVTANQQIDDRRRFTESIITGVKSGVLGVSSDDKIFLVNKSALDLLEIDASKLIGVKVFDIFPQLKVFIDEIKRSEKKYKEKQLDYLLKGKKNTFIIGVSFENYINLNSGYVITIENITELIKIQRTAAWSDIAKKIAHEIKNPLTPIQLSADRLKIKYLKNIKGDKEIFINCIDTIIRQVTTIHRMVNDFSTFTQMPRPIFEIININKIIKGSISMTKLANKNINITSNLSDIKTISLKADPNLINQALNNLIKNSINAINEKKIDKSTFIGKIYIELLTKNNFCLLLVKDNGIGLPDDKEHLTEPYISRSTKGSGLGLAVVKKIMEDHKGYLELENNSIKGGASVSLLFPLDNN
jgi:two-component system, NtrC family, nitrogen regulation sensor histidine kinase NtrY